MCHSLKWSILTWHERASPCRVEGTNLPMMRCSVASCQGQGLYRREEISTSHPASDVLARIGSHAMVPCYLPGHATVVLPRPIRVGLNSVAGPRRSSPRKPESQEASGGLGKPRGRQEKARKGEGGQEIAQVDGRAFPATQKGSFELDCVHFGRCSGCSLEKQLDQPPILDEAQTFFATLGVDSFQLVTGDVRAWRCRAKLAVRGRSHAAQIGLYAQGTHAVVDIPACTAHHPALNATVEIVREAIRDLGIAPYDEATGTGSLRYIQMVVTTHNTALPARDRYWQGKVQLALVWNARDERAAGGLLPFAQELWRRGGPRSPAPVLHSLWANFQTTRTNVILGARWRHLLGDQTLWERIAGVDVAFMPASFGQANYKAFEVLLGRLHQRVPRGSRVTELYAGAGVIGLTLAASRRCRQVQCVEVNPGCEAPFQLSRQRLPPALAATLSWHCADADVAPLQWLEGADVVIVDPPRKGLAAPVVEALRQAARLGQGGEGGAPEEARARARGEKQLLQADKRSPSISNASLWPHTLIYVSCGWEAFKRDCMALLASGAWHLSGVEAVQFFPGTDSMEVLATFRRGRKPAKMLATDAKRRKAKGRLFVPSKADV